MDARVEAAAPESYSRVHRLTDGRTLGYAEYGDPHGYPVMALHGTPGSRFMFALTDAAARERGLRIVAPERPGYGLSTFYRAGTLSQVAGDITALADALELERFAVLGVSGGSPFAIAAASLLKSRILLLGLIGPVGPIAACCDEIRMNQVHRLIFTRIAPSRRASGAFFATLRALVHTVPGIAYRLLMARVTPSDRRVLRRPEVRANLRAAIREGLRPGVGGAVQDLRLYCGPWGVPLAGIDVPAVMWQGDRDTIVPPEAAYHLARSLPNCRLEIIEGAGHYWVFGQFTRVLDAVRQAWPSP